MSRKENLLSAVTASSKQLAQIQILTQQKNRLYQGIILSPITMFIITTLPFLLNRYCMSPGGLFHRYYYSFLEEIQPTTFYSTVYFPAPSVDISPQCLVDFGIPLTNFKNSVQESIINALKAFDYHLFQKLFLIGTYHAFGVNTSEMNCLDLLSEEAEVMDYKMLTLENGELMPLPQITMTSIDYLYNKKHYLYHLTYLNLLCKSFRYLMSH